ncbi:Phosphatidic acid phosphatase, partial [Globisporangium splendens]
MARCGSQSLCQLGAFDQGQWHRLDNIGSIMSFIIWSIHLMDLPNPLHQRYLHYVFLALVLVFQEKNPWDEWNSVAPILMCFFVLFLSFAIRKQIPRYDYVQLRRGIFFLGCAVCCFICGLDDENDPFRFFHGCWHAFVGAAAYFNFRILPSPHTKVKASHLPFKKFGISYALALLCICVRMGLTRSGSDATDERAPFLKSADSSPSNSSSSSMSLADRLYAYDLTLATLTYQRFGQNPNGRLLWELLSHTGDGIMWLLMVLPVLVLAWLGGFLDNMTPATKAVTASFYICMAVDLLVIIVLKLIFKRARPPHHQTDGRFVGPDQHSFPSGHATRVGCIVGLIFYLSHTHPSIVREFFLMSPNVLCPLIVVWALWIGFSRVALGRHYPSDVAAGGCIGILVIFPIADKKRRMAFGEYECALEEADCRSQHVRFTRELWSRNFVLKHVAPHVRARSETHAMLHSGHVIVRIDGVSVSGLSMRQFVELWLPERTAAQPPESCKKVLLRSQSTMRVVTFCDRQRADVEAAMHKAWLALAPVPASPQVTVASRAELMERITQCHDWIWSHRLTAADDALAALAHVSADPLLIVSRLEIALIRVMVSNDAAHIKSARQRVKHAVQWLQALSDLPSLSVAGRTSLRIALAEAFLMSSALLFIAERNMKGMSEFRRGAAVYAELDQLCANAEVGAKMPRGMLRTLEARLHFGLGVIQLSGVMALQGFEWVKTILNVAFDPAKALDNLLHCCQVANPRSVWASLALAHSSSAIRWIQKHIKNGDDLAGKYSKVVAGIQRQYMQQYPNSVLHLWSASMSEVQSDQGTTTPLETIAIAVSLSPSDERAHLLRFDLGYRYFMNHDVENAAPLFMAICKCATAPSKLRGLCSIFLACGYLLFSETRSTPRDQLFSSVRLLLRSSLRFFEQCKVKDAEATALTQRMSVYIDSGDWYLHLLPCEILYVYCYSCYPKVPRKSAASEKPLSLHEHALSYLSRFEVQGTSVAVMGLLNFDGKVIRLNTANQRKRQRAAFSIEAQAICEWSVLRASVLYHLGNVEAARQQLETLRALLPQVPSHSFVPALVSFYRLQIHLRDHPDSRNPASKEESHNVADDLAKSHDLQYEYSYLYAGRLKALVTLVNKRGMPKAT